MYYFVAHFLRCCKILFSNFELLYYIYVEKMVRNREPVFSVIILKKIFHSNVTSKKRNVLHLKVRSKYFDKIALCNTPML